MGWLPSPGNMAWLDVWEGVVMITIEQVKEALGIWQAHKEVPGKTTVVHSQSCCDMCTQSAIVDGKTIRGQWANMCLRHFHSHGVGLGVGLGQVLIWRNP